VSPKLVVKTLDEDRFARVTQVALGEKTIVTPNFCTLVKNEKEFNSLMRLRLLTEPKYLGSFAIRLFDTLDTILPRLQNQNQMRLHNHKSVEEFFLRFYRKNITLIDPSLEYLRYEFFAGKFLRTLRRIRKPKQLDMLLHYLEERDFKKQTVTEDEYERWKKAFHRKFWYDLDRNQLERGRFVGDFIDLETMCGTDIIIPPVPIVDSEGMLDIAVRINNLTKAIAPRTKPYATYFLLQKGVLRNENLVKKIIALLKADLTQLTIFKIKNLDLWNPGRITQRENYKKLMDAMYETRKKHPSKLYIALENWYQSFPSACYGFNIVSTSMHGYDRDSKFGKNVRGSWFDPDNMWYIPYNELKKLMKNNENRLPCYCPVCKGISDLDKIDPDSWNMLRREHYVLTMNEYMRMISQAIKDKNIELAREKLANSELSGLKNLIPRSEENMGSIARSVW
jgi:hypothetical protein